MSSPYPVPRLTASTDFPISTKMALTAASPIRRQFKGISWYDARKKNCILSYRSDGLFRSTLSIVSSSINMTAGQSDEPRKLNLEGVMDKARKVWECFPQPVKSFPWTKASENFARLILDVIFAVIKYLSVPLLVISSLSEMSYSAHERKMVLIPFPLLAGIAIAGVLKDTALELSPLLKGAEVPWHLIAIAIFFTLLKLPGPYYPYWGRIFIPHFANGGLLRTLWFALSWYRSRRDASKTTLQQTSVDALYSETKEL